MLLLRSLLFFLCLLVTTSLFALPIVVLGWLLPFSAVSRIANAWGLTNVTLLGFICNLRFEIQGWENLPKGNYIVCAKHQSTWETIALRGLLPPNQTWILKRELLWIPVFGWALFHSQPIAIDRKAGRNAVKQIIEQGRRYLQMGRNIIVFPEGTRVAPGERRKYGIGGALLAQKTGYPVVPIAHNAGVFWRRRGILKYPGTVQVVIGPPLESATLTASQLNREIEDWIESAVARLPGERMPKRRQGTSP